MCLRYKIPSLGSDLRTIFKHWYQGMKIKIIQNSHGKFEAEQIERNIFCFFPIIILHNMIRLLYTIMGLGSDVFQIALFSQDWFISQYPFSHDDH